MLFDEVELEGRLSLAVVGLSLVKMVVGTLIGYWRSVWSDVLLLWCDSMG